MGEVNGSNRNTHKQKLTPVIAYRPTAETFKGPRSFFQSSYSSRDTTEKLIETSPKTSATSELLNYRPLGPSLHGAPSGEPLTLTFAQTRRWSTSNLYQATGSALQAPSSKANTRTARSAPLNFPPYFQRALVTGALNKLQAAH